MKHSLGSPEWVHIADGTAVDQLLGLEDVGNKLSVLGHSEDEPGTGIGGLPSLGEGC